VFIQPQVLQPVRRTSIAEQVATQIINLIQSGNLKAGDRLPSERKLAMQLGIGRPALREATRALSMLGILEIQHGGGIFVSALTPQDLFGPLHMYIGLDKSNVAAINEAREVIEGGVMAHIAADFPVHLLQRLQQLVDEMEVYFEQREDHGLDPERVQRDAQAFRDILAQSIQNPILLRALEGIDVLSAATRTNLTGLSRSWKPLIESHRRIVKALEQRDPKAARRSVREHIETLAGLYQVEVDPGLTHADLREANDKR
jgi:DNA-binding FadR family transcriptional regulator